MRKTALPAAFAVAAALLAAGCGTDGKPLLGSSISGGTDTVAAKAKVGNGGIIATAGSAQLSPRALKSALDAEYQALEFSTPGQPVKWSAGGASGEVTAATPYQVGEQNCRAYEHTVFAAGDPATARGTACRNEDGTWTPLS